MNTIKLFVELSQEKKELLAKIQTEIFRIQGNTYHNQPQSGTNKIGQVADSVESHLAYDLDKKNHLNAFCYVDIYKYPNSTIIYISDLYVDPAKRNKGFGKKIVKFVMQSPTPNNVFMLALNLTEGVSQLARYFIKNFGFNMMPENSFVSEWGNDTIGITTNTFNNLPLTQPVLCLKKTQQSNYSPELLSLNNDFINLMLKNIGVLTVDNNMLQLFQTNLQYPHEVGGVITTETITTSYNDVSIKNHQIQYSTVQFFKSFSEDMECFAPVDTSAPFSYHTHPQHCINKFRTIYEWPSSQDLSNFYRGNKTNHIHIVATPIGNYVVRKDQPHLLAGGIIQTQHPHLDKLLQTYDGLLTSLFIHFYQDWFEMCKFNKDLGHCPSNIQAYYYFILSCSFRKIITMVEGASVGLTVAQKQAFNSFGAVEEIKRFQTTYASDISKMDILLDTIPFSIVFTPYVPYNIPFVSV